MEEEIRMVQVIKGMEKSAKAGVAVGKEGKNLVKKKKGR